MRRIGRSQLDVRRVVGNGKVVGKILSGLGVLLLRKAGDVLDRHTSQTDARYLLKHIALRSAVANGTSGGYSISISGLSNSQLAVPKAQRSSSPTLHRH